MDGPRTEKRWLTIHLIRKTLIGLRELTKGEEWETDFSHALNDILQFYNSELQSKAVMATSFALILLATVTLKPLDFPLIVVWLVAISGLATAIVFSLLRLFIYGAHSAAILWGDWKDVWYVRDERVEWEAALPQTQVSVYCNWYYRTYILPKKRLFGVLRLSWIFSTTAHPKAKILVSFAVGFFVVSFSLVFWNSLQAWLAMI